MTKTLEPSSNPNIIIVHEDSNPNLNTSPMLLNGTNYVIWSKAASMHLYSRSKMGFVAGKKPAPAPDNPASGDNLVRSLLINSVEPWLVEDIWGKKFLYIDQELDAFKSPADLQISYHLW